MSYTKHEFKSGEKLFAAQLNAMDEQIAANADAGEELSKKVENLTGNSVGLNEDAVNLLIDILRKATYTEDVSYQIARLSEILGGNTDEPDVPEGNSIKLGTINFEGGIMALNATPGWSIRGTLVPIGRYLEKGKMYKFGLGAIADKYSYGVQIFTAESAELTFPYVADNVTSYTGVSARLVDTGWMRTEYTYTPEADNCILAVNFKTLDGASMGESHYAEILENFVFEEIAQ